MKKIFYLLLSVFLFCSKQLWAHEPLFGLGPELIRTGGFAIEGEIEHEKRGYEKETTVNYDIMYGVTEYLAISAEIPFFINKEDLDEQTNQINKSAGLGKIEIRAKLRIYKDYLYGKRDQAVLIGGFRLPTVGLHKNPFLENRLLDFIIALAAGREMLKNSYFGTVAYDIKTQANGLQDGNELTLTLAAGFRPETATYYNLDWLFFIEIDGVFTAKDRSADQEDQDSGGYVFFIGPTIFASKKNILLKAGIQVPMIEHVNGQQVKHDLRFAVGLDLHF
ncbi:hypothetical protein IPF37_04120 [bacterium]|nr:MAG: hypothetical protein IPF37_04120 [bacterium]